MKNLFQILLKTVSLVLMLLISCAQLYAADDDLNKINLPDIDESLLETRINELEAEKDIEGSEKEKYLKAFKKIREDLDRTDEYVSAAKNAKNQKSRLPGELDKLKKELALKQQGKSGLKLPDTAVLSLDEIDRLLEKEKADNINLESSLEDLQSRRDRQINLPLVSRERLVELSRQRETLVADANFKGVNSTSSNAEITKEWTGIAKLQLIAAEINKLEQELANHQVNLQILETRSSLTDLALSQSVKVIRVLEDALGQKRIKEVEQLKQEQEALNVELKDKHPLVSKIARENVVLSDDLASTTIELEKIAARDEKIKNQTRRISNELDIVKQKLAIAGLSESLGQLLIEHRKLLPPVPELEADQLATLDLVSDVSLKLVRLFEMQRKVKDTEFFIESLTVGLPENEVLFIREQLLVLGERRKEILDKSIANVLEYRSKLGEIDLAEQNLIEIVKSYNELLNKNLLWIRSADPFSPSKFSKVSKELLLFFSPLNWLQLLESFWQGFAEKPQNGIATILLILMAFYRKRFLQYAFAYNDRVGKVRADQFNYTVYAILWIGLASLTLPLLIFFLGWQLSVQAGLDNFSNAISKSLQGISVQFLLLMFLYDMTARNGLMEKHFRWSPANVQKLRKEIRLLIFTFIPAGFFAFYFNTYDAQVFDDGLGLIFIAVTEIIIGVFVYRILSPNAGIITNYITKHRESLLVRFWGLMLGSIFFGLSVLVLLVFLGYVYTSGILTRHIIETTWLILLLILVKELFTRWLLIVRRRLIYQNKVERMIETKQADTQDSDTQPHAKQDIVEVEEPEIDLNILDSESKKLLNTTLFYGSLVGLWLIWSPVFPALSVLDEISLWSYTDSVEGVDTLKPITLASIGLAFIIAVISYSASKGIPALIEFFLLQKTRVLASSRYTATTLTRYIIIGFGFALFFNVLGVQWSSIQWLVAALGVGIGFGLQEIVANFISGLIILFERPIRVGDVVSVGDTSGVVTRIEIRATTITNWDRQELVVPNKEFITGRLLNWSLSDPINRLRINVGIAYGSDVTRALALLQEVAEEHSNVMADPPPLISFDSFGDNALNLQMRVYIPSIENRIQTISELNKMVNDKFNAAGIVIAFPQRDIHLDTSTPIEIRLNPSEIKSEYLDWKV